MTNMNMVYTMNMLDKGMIDVLGRMEQDGRFHPPLRAVDSFKLKNCLYLEPSI